MLKRLIILFFLFSSGCYSQIARYEIPCSFGLLYDSQTLMLKQVGVKEVTPNWSLEIQKYWEPLGITYPIPYCAAGIYYCFWYYRNDYYIPILKTANANAQYNHFKKNGVKTKYIPKQFDFIVWQSTKYNYQGHIESIYHVGKYGWVTTIGFNTGTNTRDGQGVVIKQRNIFNAISILKVRGLCGFLYE